MPREWSSGLFDCCANGALTCIMGFCLYSPLVGIPGHILYDILIGLSARKMDESFLLCCCAPAGHLLIRSKIRGEQGIEGSLLKDCLIIHFCTACAAIQEANEIDKVYSGQPK